MFYFFTFSQGKQVSLSLDDRKVHSPKKYFDTNDPNFLISFVNAQSSNKKLKLLDKQIKKSKFYRSISKDEMSFFIDSIRDATYKDTGKFCYTGLSSIKQSNAYIPQSHYIIWVNYMYWYRVGDNGKNTMDFANEFLVSEKIKSLAIVSPPPEKNIQCMDKTIAHIYLVTNKRIKFDYSVARMKFNQIKLGHKWIGHN